MLQFFNAYGFLIVSMVLGACLGLSLYLPLMAGQLSLASPGFYTLGGYIAAIISTKYWHGTGTFPIGWVLGEMVLGGLVSAVVAFSVGVPSLRLRGIYFAIATIAFVEILRVLALTLDITGKAVGISNIPQPFSSSLAYLTIALPLLIGAMVFVGRLERIRVGRALLAIREDELAADAMGINPGYYKVLSFVLGAILAGMVGAVSAHFLNTWNPRQGTFDASITQLAFVVIGGARTFVGPVLGGIVLTALPEVLREMGRFGGLPPWLAQFFQEGRLIFFGAFLILGSIYYPQGIVTPTLVKSLTAKLRSALGSRK